MSEDLWSFVLYRGLVLGAILCAQYLLSWVIDKRIWFAERFDKPQEGNAKGYLAYLCILFASLTALLTSFDITLLNTIRPPNQTTLFAINLCIIGVYCLLDLLAIDLFLYRRLQPDFMALKPYGHNRSVWHHITYAVRLFIFSGVFAFVSTVLALEI